MARLPRFDLPDVAQHVVQRGNDRQPCFAAPADYSGYLCEFGEAALKHGCVGHAYVLIARKIT